MDKQTHVETYTVDTEMFLSYSGTGLLSWSLVY